MDVTEYMITLFVVVKKPNSTVQLWCNFKVSVNLHFNLHKYQMPTYREVFQALAGGTHLTVLDCN